MASTAALKIRARLDPSGRSRRPAKARIVPSTDVASVASVVSNKIDWILGLMGPDDHVAKSPSVTAAATQAMAPCQLKRLGS